MAVRPKHQTQLDLKAARPLYSLIVLWHECIRQEPALTLRKWAGKDQASFAEMVAALRADSLAELKRKHLSMPEWR